MANSIINVKLKPENFVEVNDKPISRWAKDFFKKDHDGFVTHKQDLIASIKSIVKTLESQPSGPIGFLKVVLRQEAWAKSYRPINNLFKKNLMKIVGGGNLGEMIFEVKPEHLEYVEDQIEKEEMDFQIDYETRKISPKVSRLRCEVGAIERLELWQKKDKRIFTPKQAVERLTNPSVNGFYCIELFHKLQRNEEEVPEISESVERLHRSFLKGFADLQQNIVAYLIHSKNDDYSQLYVKLNRKNGKSEFNIIEIDENFTNTDVIDGREKNNGMIEQDVSEHKRLLSFLDKHPLVKRVELPAELVQSVGNPILTDGSTLLESDNSDKETLISPEPAHCDRYPKIGVIDSGMGDFLKPWIKGLSRVFKHLYIHNPASAKNVRHGSFIGGLLVEGNQRNSVANCPEEDGAILFDLDLFTSNLKHFCIEYTHNPYPFFLTE